ncbi:MAG TPA: YbhB/YbcL family Raf kinase inhibitor-like protein [Pseudomonadales bacterium]|nr:YbhB/YbcL family Raf kinase inhibitor-like protein [Pseudomonadales bacterium]
MQHYRALLQWQQRKLTHCSLRALLTALCFSPLVACTGQKGFHLSSPDFTEGQALAAAQVLKGFGCAGSNVSPALNWEGAPAGTKSFAITAYDPDAPTGSGWWHWVIFNIPASTTSLSANAGNLSTKLAPTSSIQSRTDFGGPGYGGPCPPVGDSAHRYQFTVYALNVDHLPLDENASGALVGFYLNQHALGRATLEGRYSR